MKIKDIPTFEIKRDYKRLREIAKEDHDLCCKYCDDVNQPHYYAESNILKELGRRELKN